MKCSQDGRKGFAKGLFILSASLRKETNGHALLHASAAAATLADLVEGLSTTSSRVRSSRVLGERAERNVESRYKEILNNLCFFQWFSITLYYFTWILSSKDNTEKSSNSYDFPADPISCI